MKIEYEPKGQAAQSTLLVTVDVTEPWPFPPEASAARTRLSQDWGRTELTVVKL